MTDQQNTHSVKRYGGTVAISWGKSGGAYFMRRGNWWRICAWRGAMTASQDRRSVRQLRDLEAKATPGPWAHLAEDAESHRAGWSRFGAGEQLGEVYNVHDGALLVAARNALPTLLDAVEALEWISGPEGFPPVPAAVLAREMQARARAALAAVEGRTEA